MHENKEFNTYMAAFFRTSPLFMATRQENLTKQHVYSCFARIIEKLGTKLSCYLHAAWYISQINVARLLGGRRLESNKQ